MWFLIILGLILAIPTAGWGLLLVALGLLVGRQEKVYTTARQAEGHNGSGALVGGFGCLFAAIMIVLIMAAAGGTMLGDERAAGYINGVSTTIDGANRNMDKWIVDSIEGRQR